VSRGVDTVYSRDLEIPGVVWVSKGSHEPARGGIDVDGDIVARLFLEFVELVRHPLNRLEDTSVGGSEDAVGINWCSS
jgi:hypothetical protein